MKCVYKNCNVTDKDEPKRTYHRFPLEDKERCQKWVEACDNEEITEQFSNGELSNDACICGFHFPLAYRKVKLLPKHVNPIANMVDLTTEGSSTGSGMKFINSEHSYMKRYKVENSPAAIKTSPVAKKLLEKLPEVIESPLKSKFVKKYEVKEVEITKSVPQTDDHMYFVNVKDSKDGTAADNDSWYRFSVIHQKTPEAKHRTGNFHIFTDTATSRWTSIPHNQKVKYMSKIIKHYTIDPQVKVTDLSKAVNRDMEISLRDVTNEEETEHWDLHSSDATANVHVTMKSSTVLPQLGRRFPHIPAKPIPGTSILKSSLKQPATVMPVIESVRSLPNDPHWVKVNSNKTLKNEDQVRPGFCETKVKEVFGVPVKITGPFKNNHTVFSRQTLVSLGLTPQNQFGDFDFTNCEMTYWHYQCDNGVVETIVECVSLADRTRVVRIPAKQVIHQLLAVNKKSQYLKTATEKKKEKDKLKCKEHAKEIRRLRNRILQLQKEIDSPKAYEKFLNYDQIEAMEKDSTQGHHWKDDTIVLAHNIRLACTTKGYKYLYKKLHWPLPSIKTLRKRAKELHLPCPEVVRAVLVRKPGEGKKKVTTTKVHSSLDDDSEDGSSPKRPSVISINPPSAVSSPGLVKLKRKTAVKKSPAKPKNLTVDVNQLSDLIYDNEIDFNGQIIKLPPSVRTVSTGKKKKMEITEDELAVKKIKTLEEEPEEMCFEETVIPEFLDESEVYYKFIKLEDEVLQGEDGQIILNYDGDRLQTLANASIVHESPTRGKKVIKVVQNVNYENSDLNSNRFQKFFNVSNFDGF